MLVHIGNDFLVKGEEILGIFDIDGRVTPEITKEYLREAQKRDLCVSSVDDIPRSFLVATKKKKKKSRKKHDETVDKVIFSHISSATLTGRIK